MLTEMNQQLIIDEGSKNTMSVLELEERMRNWLQTGREAVIVQRDQETIGYMLFWYSTDEYYPYQNSINVRQFFIQPSYRRRGIGQQAFDQIVNEYFAAGSAIMLDVLESNPEGKEFWQKLGFSTYCVTMRRDPVENQSS
jgi:ribosomal protein S18 acetylase RimI-like enzyme